MKATMEYVMLAGLVLTLAYLGVDAMADAIAESINASAEAIAAAH